MSDIVNITVDLDKLDIENKLYRVINDKQAKTQIHNLLIQMCDKYVPSDTRTLAQSAQAYADYAYYPGPYAHYQYMGEVYGPNFVGWEDYVTPGWRSKSPKHPTGRELGKPGHAVLQPQFGTDKNKEPIEWDFGYTTPNTTHHWDKRMLENDGEQFKQEVTKILAQRLRELYG